MGGASCTQFHFDMVPLRGLVGHVEWLHRVAGSDRRDRSALELEQAVGDPVGVFTAAEFEPPQADDVLLV